ncbi:MAG: hypothetical protein K6E18_03450 [Lachnospiraceae bacterium]|nr:hypothetical protein [Lachnospiraceae bacterium]
MWIVFDFIKTNYITLLILITLLVMMATNRSNQIPGTGMILVMCCIIFLITLAEYAEVVIDNQNLDYRLLYVKAALVYWLYPLLILLFLFITDHVKYRVLMTIPWLIHAVVVAIDLTGTGLMYHYGPDHGFHGGVLAELPIFVEAFYVVLLVIYSIRNLKEQNRIKGGIITFIALGVILTQILTFLDFPNSYIPAVAGMEIMT